MAGRLLSPVQRFFVCAGRTSWVGAQFWIASGIQLDLQAWRGLDEEMIAVNNWCSKQDLLLVPVSP